MSTGETRDEPESSVEEGRYGSFRLEEDDVLVYDRDDPECWVQSDTSVSDFLPQVEFAGPEHE